MAPRAPPIFYGWRVVAVAFLIAVFAWGLGFYGPSLYVNELVRSRGWSITLVSGAVTVHFLFSAALVMFLADAHDRFGLVAVTRGGLAAFYLGVIGWANAAEPWHLYPAALLTGAGWSALSGAAINAFVAPWFATKRGFALSHAYNGASVGGILFTPLWATLIARYGFPNAAIGIAGVGLIVLWPVVGRYLRATPQALGLQPDGIIGNLGEPHALGHVAPASPRRALLRDRRLLSLSVAFAIGIFAQMGLITHLLLRLTPTLGVHDAALALSLATACAIIGRFTLAGFTRPEHLRTAGGVNFGIQAMGTLLLVLGETPMVLLAGCVLFGLGIGNLLSLPPLILQTEQHPRDVGRALALLTAINQVLYAFAPGVFGLLRDATGAYTVPFALAAAAQILAAVIVVAFGRRKNGVDAA